MIEWEHTTTDPPMFHTLIGRQDGELVVTGTAIVLGGKLIVRQLVVEEAFRGDDALAEEIYAGALQTILDLGFADLDDLVAWKHDEATNRLTFGNVDVMLNEGGKEVLDRYFGISQATIDWAVAIRE